MLVKNKNVLLKVLKTLEEANKDFKRNKLNNDGILLAWFEILNKFAELEHQSIMQVILEKQTQSIELSLAMLLQLKKITEHKERVNKIFEDLFNYYVKHDKLDKNVLLIDIVMG